MRKPDDCTLSTQDLSEVRRYADTLLREANAHGRFPTPVPDILTAAKLTVERHASLDSGFLRRLYRNVTSPIKRVVDKVLGLIDLRDKRIYLDHSVHPKKKNFISLHETGHDFLPWQRQAYARL